ncbi:MAG: hypothetical protein HPY69_20380 [Armatimonadetes bacterium]|nr:hypothetical protein [Armatimonadota bacterium]
MRAGFADLDITPAPGEELTGYGYYLGRRATGTLDPLHARALALEEGGAAAVVVQLDLIGLTKEFVADVRMEMADTAGLPPENLLLHCTHTHSGPAIVPVEGCGRPSEEFPLALREQVLTVIRRALDDLRPVRGTSRFALDWPDGFAWNRIGGPDLDTHVRGVRIEVEGSLPIAVLSYSCHPVTLGVNRQYSADYCGAVLQEFSVYGTRALFLNGCCGDVDPISNAYAWGSGTRETLLIYGRDLAQVARQGMAQATTWTPGAIRGVSRGIILETEPMGLSELTDALERLRQTPVDDRTGPQRVDIAWHEAMIRRHKEGTLTEAATAEIQAIACGDVVFVGCSAETFTRLGQIIRESAPHHHLLIAATSNGVLGYIGTEDDVRNRGYASLTSCKIYGMALPVPGAGEKWARAGARVVAEAIG